MVKFVLSNVVKIYINKVYWIIVMNYRIIHNKQNIELFFNCSDDQNLWNSYHITFLRKPLTESDQILIYAYPYNYIKEHDVRFGKLKITNDLHLILQFNEKSLNENDLIQKFNTCYNNLTPEIFIKILPELIKISEKTGFENGKKDIQRKFKKLL